MTIGKLARYLLVLEKTSSRIEITKILADLFKESSEYEIGQICYLVLGLLAPRYQSEVFNIADKLVLQSISRAYDTDLKKVKVSYKEMGDLGEVAIGFAETKKQKNLKTEELRVSDVYEKLLSIAKDEGEGSVERKIDKLSDLLKSVDPLSAKYIVRIPLGKLRLGFSDKTILDALSWMEKGDKSMSNKIEEAYAIFPDVGYLAMNIRKRGVDGTVKNINPKIGVPLLPMLAQRLKSPSDMIDKMKKVYVEPKFDGLRIQIHFKRSGFEDGTFVKAYTRNLNETSWMFPEFTDIGKQINANEIIFDSEAIGIDEQRKTLSNFQSTMTRRRKHDIEKISEKVRIRFYVFDVMYKDGESLINKPYDQRRDILEKSVEGKGILQVVDYEITEDARKINDLMQEELRQGMEGIIVKSADSKYIAGRKGWRWVKMKEEEGQRAKLADTIDCVVMGYITGRGKRTQFGIGGFLAGVLDKDNIRTLTKVGTGLTDDQFRQLAKRLKSAEVGEKPKEFGEVSKTLIPDVWVTPSLVVELAADEITKSPIHASGFALRFPRLVKFREDKKWEDATSLDEIKGLFRLQ